MRMTNRSGSIVVLVAIMMVVLLGFGAFAVDLSQMQAYKSELRRTADAAVLAATLQLLHDTQYDLAPLAAQDFVHANRVMGDTVSLSPLEYGRYIAGNFQPLQCNPACPADSIRAATAIRLTVSGGGHFYLAQFIGGDTFDLSAVATAWLPVVGTPCAAPWAVTRTFWDTRFPGTLPSSGPSATTLRGMSLVGSAKIMAIKQNDLAPAGTPDVWFGAMTLPPFSAGTPLWPNSAEGYARNIANLDGCNRLQPGMILQGKITGLDIETTSGVSGIGGLPALCSNLAAGFCYNSGGQIGVAVSVPIVDSLTSGTPCLTTPLYDPDDRLYSSPGQDAVCFSVVEVGTFVVLRTPENPVEAGRIIAAYAGIDTIGPVRGFAQRPILVQ